MISYASVDRIEGNFAICEVELVEVEKSSTFKFFEKETEMIDLAVEKIIMAVGSVQEGDILVVMHNCESISYVLYKDEEEKQARINLLKEIMGK